MLYISTNEGYTTGEDAIINIAVFVVVGIVSKLVQEGFFLTGVEIDFSPIFATAWIVTCLYSHVANLLQKDQE